MSLADLSKLHLLISQATRPEDVFGESVRRSGPLEQEYLRLARIADPSSYAGDPSAKSSARYILTRLYELHQAALVELRDAQGAGGQDAASDAASSSGSHTRASASVGSDPEAVNFAVTTARGTYQADSLLAHGDLTTLYLGYEVKGNQLEKPVAIKVADEPQDNDLLHDEAKTLRLFQGVPSPQQKHLPELLDQFQTPDGRAGTVLRFIEGYHLLAIRRRYRQGIPGEHAIWIMRRLLSVLGFAHSQGVIHGNVEPAHIIVQPPDHNVILIDWSYSIVAPGQTGQGFKALNPDYSAPEVAERKPPIPASDLYSVGKSMIMLLGGNIREDTLPESVDPRLARFVQFFVRPSPIQRPQDAWEMFGQLKTLREEIYGPHQFQTFEM